MGKSYSVHFIGWLSVAAALDQAAQPAERLRHAAGHRHAGKQAPRVDSRGCRHRCHRDDGDDRPKVAVGPEQLGRPLHDLRPRRGSDLGVTISTNGGATWSRLGKGLPYTTVMDVHLGPDGRVYAATHGRGIWSIVP